jgi:hypothetical protein
MLGVLKNTSPVGVLVCGGQVMMEYISTLLPNIGDHFAM